MTARINVLHRMLRAQEERLADVEYDRKRALERLAEADRQRAEVLANIERIKAAIKYAEGKPNENYRVNMYHNRNVMYHCGGIEERRRLGEGGCVLASRRASCVHRIKLNDHTKGDDYLTKQLLTDEFIAQYPDFPEEMTPLGQFVYYRTYSRWLPDQKRRETWKETCRRSVEYNVGLARKHVDKIGYTEDYDSLRKEAEEFFDNMFHLRQFLSGRTLWVGGSENGVADKYPLANFNCSFINIRKWDDLSDLFYLLLVGTGVGFKCTKEFARELPPIRTNVEVIHEPYTQRYPLTKIADTSLHILEDEDKAVIHVGDSKEGWVDALRKFFEVLTDEKYESIVSIGIYYDYVRPKGARLNTFGGTASGHEPLREMFEGIVKVLRNEIDPTLEPLECVYNTQYSKVRPIHILDIGNLIGNNVVVGGKPYASDVNKNSSLSVKL